MVWGERTRGERPDGEDWTGCRASFTACVHDVIHCRLARVPQVYVARTWRAPSYVDISRRPTKNRRLLTSTHACTAKITPSVTDPRVDQARCFVCEYVTTKTSDADGTLTARNYLRCGDSSRRTRLINLKTVVRTTKRRRHCYLFSVANEVC